MNPSPFIAKLVLAVLAIGTTAAFAGTTPDPRPCRNNNNNGYLPWAGYGFGPADANSGPQQPQAKVVDVAPAVGQAAFAESEFDNRWADLQVMLDRARKDFQMSDEYASARKDADQAQSNYDAAVDTVLARLENDSQYKDLIEKKTEAQIALKSAPVDTGLRNVVAFEKLQFGSLATQMEAVALANDSTVQDARARLVSANENLRLKEKQFESQLYNRPEVAAARQQMEVARSNKAGAEGYLYGTYITRADQLNLNEQYNNGNNVFYTPWPFYYRGYYGPGSF